MARRRESRRRAKDVSNPQEATKVELVTATLYLIGGDTRFVVLDELAIACHRLAPAVFSWPEYTWLPSLDSVRVTLVDVKRAGLAEEGSEGRGRTLKGIRLSQAGRDWATRNESFLQNLRQRLPDASRYVERSSGELVAVAILSAAEEGKGLIPRDRVVAEAYRLFPERFALHAFAGWPDSARVEEGARGAAWLSASPEGWAVRPEHRHEVARLREELHVTGAEGFGATQRRQSQGTSLRAVKMIEGAALWKRYATAQEAAEIADEDVCDILAVTLESTPATVRKHLDSMTRLVEQAERWDLLEFLSWIRRWCEARDFKLVQT